MNHPKTSSSLEQLREQHEALLLRAETARLESELRLHDLASHHVLESEWGDIVNRCEYLYDTPGFADNRFDDRVSRPDDRREGRYRPVFENEFDLAWIRGVGRWVYDHYEIGQAAIENLASFVIGTGYTYELHCSDEKQDKAHQNLLQHAQRLLDRIWKRNGWRVEDGGLEDESLRFSRIDGESFLWVKDCQGELPEICDVCPDYITEPASPRDIEDWKDMGSHCWSFGIATPHGKPSRPIAYFVQWEGDPQNWEIADASDMVHVKVNVPRGVKRGISDFYCVEPGMARTYKLFGNTQQGTAIQAAIAFIRQHKAGTSNAAITSFAVGKSDGSFTLPKAGGGQITQRIKKYAPGTIIDTSENTEYKYGPLGQPSANVYLDVVAAGIRMAGLRWQMPEYMISGDASNANYSSTLIAGGPFDRATKRKQAFHGGRFSQVGMIALGHMANRGEFAQYGIHSSSELDRALKIVATAPDVSLKNDLEQENIRKIRKDAGVLSAKTWAAQVDLDYDEEKANGAGQQPSPVPGKPEEGQQATHKPTDSLQGLESILESIRDNVATENTSYALGNEDPLERAQAIADLLYAIYGEDANDILAEMLSGTVQESAGVLRDFDPNEHPRGKDGRFIKKGSADAFQETKAKIAESLKKGKTKESAAELMQHLNNLTVVQIRGLQKEYGLSASGKVKADLVKKLAERLDKGRRVEEPKTKETAATEKQPANPKKPAAKANKTTATNNDTAEQAAVKLDQALSAIDLSQSQGRKQARQMAKAFAEKYATRSLVKRSGMTELEQMKSVKLSGTEFNWTEKADIGNTILSYYAMPKTLRDTTSVIVLTSQRNKNDPYFEKLYNMPNFLSEATGGVDGTIVKYNVGNKDLDLFGTSIHTKVMAHEMGHNLATKRYGSTKPDAEWSVATDGEEPVTEYGKVSKDEDFAEAVQMYVVDNVKMRQRFPKRYSAIKQILG